MNHGSLWVPLGSACTVSASPSEEIIKRKVAIKHVKKGLAGGRGQPVCRRGCPRGARGFRKRRQQPGESFPTSSCPPASSCSQRARSHCLPYRSAVGSALPRAQIILAFQRQIFISVFSPLVFFPKINIYFRHNLTCLQCRVTKSAPLGRDFSLLCSRGSQKTVIFPPESSQAAVIPGASRYPVSALCFLLDVLFPLCPFLLLFNFLMLNQKAPEVRSCRLCLSHESQSWPQPCTERFSHIPQILHLSASCFSCFRSLFRSQQNG